MSLADNKSCVWVKCSPNMLSDAKIDLLKISQKDRNKKRKNVFLKVFNSSK
jgi:ssDNA-binding replication factor A large subunit